MYNEFITLKYESVLPQYPLATSQFENSKEYKCMKLTYIRKGNYLYPNLTISSETQQPIGKYGLLRKSFLKEHKPDLYQSMLLTGKLDVHLAEIDRVAQRRMDHIVEHMLKSNPAPSKEDQLSWVAHMNGITAAAEEIVLTELIYC